MIQSMRLKAGILMIALFSCILLSGNLQLISLLVALLQVKIFQELRRVGLVPGNVHLEKRQIKSDWCLFVVCALSILSVFWSNQWSLLGCFLFYNSWFIAWILFILNKEHEASLGSYVLHTSWVHLCILYTLSQPMLIYHNMLKGGIFWFLFPCSLVICNDIAAYAWGKYVGKTMLLSLSPKKTMEGFIGALMTTILFAYIFSAWLIKFDGLIQDKHNTLYNCIQYHAVILALYASLVAPFGGFFASAIKRASGLKDFGSFIPGHGGLSDRLDCQLFMAMFVYLYYDTIQ